MKNQRKRLNQNLNLLQKINPKLAFHLSSTDPADLEFCQTQQNELNLKRTYRSSVYYYHSQISALGEAVAWFQGLNLHQATVLYIYGIGLGYYYEATKSWLKSNPDHVLVFLERDCSVLYHLFETERGTEILKNPQVHLVYFSNLDKDKSLFEELAWSYLFCPFIVSSLKLYQEEDPQGFLQLYQRLSYEVAEKGSFLNEYLSYGTGFFKNFYLNLLELPYSYLGNDLFNQFKHIPAIICGAGPSLKKNLSILKTLTDRALIFAGGSALNALTHQGLIPHFGAGIDPNQAQYERIQKTHAYGIPFFIAIDFSMTPSS